MELTPDTILNSRYRITRLLGKGGMGAVYLAYDNSLDQQVAVKSNHSSQTESADQFLREAQLLATLRHPNLPRVIDYFILENTQYLVMDYIPGEDLGSILQREGVQPVENVLKWATELGEALAYLHRQNPPVIHRDIKPGNIKLSNEGEAILVDFGIAKAAESSQATAAGAFGYTPGYAPPEQYGSARTGPYSDQFSLAATLYALLTDQTPTDSVQRALGQAVLTPMQLLNPKIPPHVQRAIERAMSPRPQDRFENTTEFIRSLTNSASQPTLQTHPEAPSEIPNPSPKTEKKSSKKWIWISGGAALLLLVGIVSIGGLRIIRRNLSPAKFTQSSTPSAALPTAIFTETEMAANLLPTAAPLLTATPEPTGTPLPTSTPMPQYLADGKPITFISNRGNEQIFQIWTMNVVLSESGELSSSNLKQLTFDPEDKAQPAWSPDGTKLLYTSIGASAENGTDIWMLDLANEGSMPINLSNQKGDDSYPIWSPDGKKIAYVNKNRFTDVLQIFVMNSDGSEQRRISGDYYEYAPAWSPDMKWMLNIIYAKDHHYFHIRDWIEEPIPTPIPTSKPFDRQAFFGRQGEVIDFQWSSNGQQIAFTRKDGTSRQIYSMDFATRGEKTTLLTSGTRSDYEPAWAPDNQWIVFTSERDSDAEIYIMTATGLLQTNLTHNPDGVDMQPVWQP